MKHTRITLLTLLALIAASAGFAGAAEGAASAQTVRVTETSYAIRLSAKPRPGLVTFNVRNLSDDGHDFWLRGGGKTWKTRVLSEGGAARLTARLRRGVRYSYWCAVGSHRTKGMSGSFVVR